MQTIKHSPKVIFVDGPTGVGKDYLIDKLTEEYKKRFPFKSITQVRASDYVATGDCSTELRKYTSYDTDISKIYNIGKRHLSLINHLYEMTTIDSGYDLVIVNRSYVSMIIYNIIPAVKKLLIYSQDNVKAHDELTLFADDESDLEHNYVSLLNKCFHKEDVLYLNVEVKEEPNKTNVDIILDRIASRNDGKPIAKGWIAYIIMEYKRVCERCMYIYPNMENVTSDDSVFILDKYF